MSFTWDGPMYFGDSLLLLPALSVTFFVEDMTWSPRLNE